jgi:LuxR family transcriptional regulator, maltose regulon positive regulatory protein
VWAVGRLESPAAPSGSPPPGVTQARNPDDTIPVLLARLVPPALPPTHVRRERLLRELDGALTRPVTMLVAGAGAGKTVLLSSWVAEGRSPDPVAWVSLERGDPPAGVWNHLLTALVRCGVVPGGVVRGADRHGAHPPDAAMVLTYLINGLAEGGRGVVIVLDDVHLLPSDGLAGLEFLLSHPVGQMHLVLSARYDPVRLHRQRVAGQVSEVTAASLAFTADEASALLVAHGVGLAAGERDRLLERTEGWAAGLRMSALALRDGSGGSGGSAVPSAGVTTIGDYLGGEVLAAQPPAVRRFLLRTSVLSRLSGALADAVAGGRDATETSGAGLLAELARSNAFVVGLDPDGTWYRYHHLFGEVLRAQLGRDTTEDPDELHLRAALWYAAHGDGTDAARHAAAACDWRYVSSLLVGDGLAALFTRPGAPREMLPGIPDDLASMGPECAIVAAAAHALDGDPDAARGCLDVARAGLPTLPPDRRRAAMLSVDLVEARRALLAGDASDLLTAARRLLRATSAAMAASAVGGGTSRGGGIAVAHAWALGFRGIGEAWTRRSPAAVASLLAGRDAARRAGARFPERVCSAELALVYAGRGGLRQATAHAAAALAGPAGAEATGVARLALALVAYAEGDLTDVECDAAEAAGGRDRHPVAANQATVLRARRLAACGRLAAARHLLTSRSGVRPDELPPSAAALHAAARADLLTAAGHHEDALATACDPDGGRPSDPDRVLAFARAAVASGDHTGAAMILRPVLRMDVTGLGPGTLVEACVLAATAAQAAGDAATATESLDRALAIAVDEGIRRPFLDGGEPVRALLREHPGLSAAHPAFVAGILGAHVTRPRGGPPAAASAQVAEGVTVAGRFAATSGVTAVDAGPATGVDVAGGGDRARPRVPASRPPATGTVPATSRVVGVADRPDTPVPPAGALARDGRDGTGRDGTGLGVAESPGEPLSERERAVLSYLPTMLTTAEIATEMFVSVNTVKTHLKSIYRKLGVARRRDAVRRARALAIL